MEMVFSEPVVNLPYGGKADAPLDVSSQICIGEYEILENGEVRLGPHGKRWLLEEKAKEGKRKVLLGKDSEDQAHHPPKSALGFPSILHWILNTSSSRHSLADEGINFVCYASILERIASTPFNPEQDWQFLITKLYKVIFIGAGPDEAERDAEKSKLDQMFLHYLSTSESQERRPQRAVERPSPTFENGLHCNVFVKCFNNFKVVYAMNGGCMGKDGRFVQCITTEKDVSSAEEWWLPAYLCGGHTTIVGNMDGKDLVKEIHAYNVGNTDPETENVAQHFLFNTLSVLSKAMETTSEWAPFVFEYNAKKQQFSLHTIPELLPQSFTSQFELFHFSELKPKE